MTDDEVIKKIRQITDPKHILEEIVEAVEVGYFGHDPYYADIKNVLISQAKNILKNENYLGKCPNCGKPPTKRRGFSGDPECEDCHITWGYRG